MSTLPWEIRSLRVLLAFEAFYSLRINYGKGQGNYSLVGLQGAMPLHYLGLIKESLAFVLRRKALKRRASPTCHYVAREGVAISKNNGYARAVDELQLAYEKER